jgi:hypothetical protein
MQSDPGYNNRYSNGNNVYPTTGGTHGYQQSRDTVNTNGSNGSHSDPYSDPNSDNSSVERATPVRPPQPDLGEQYGFQGFGGGPILEEYGGGARPSNSGYPKQQQNGYGIPPPVPAKAGPPPPPTHGVPIKLNQSQAPAVGNGDGRPNVLTRQNTDKRRSWFKRRFSKE